MTVRARMLVGFAVLAVIPMVVIVLVSYGSSIAAFRAAVESESQATAREMNLKVTRVSEHLDASLAAAATIRPTGEAGQVQPGTWLERFREDVRPLAPLLEAAEFVPAAPPAEDGASPGPPSEAPSPPEPGEAEAADRSGTVMFFHLDQESEGHDEPAGGPPADAGQAEEAAAAAAQAVEAARVIGSLSAFGSDLARRYREDPDGFRERIADEGTRLLEGIEGLEGAAETGAKLALRSALQSEVGRKVLAEGVQAVDEVSRELSVAVQEQMQLSEEQRELLANRTRQARELLGRSFRYEVREGPRVVGHVEARVRAEDVIRGVLEGVDRQAGEIPYAVDGEGRRYTLSEEDGRLLDGLRQEPEAHEGWVLVEKRDEATGVTFGIARPLGEGLQSIRSTAVRNLLFGAGLIGLATVLMVPASRRLTRRLGEVTSAAGALATGDLSVRVPEGRRDELGLLARAFNRMAGDLDEHQRRLLEEQRRRQEDELGRRVLEMDHARKSRELEEARRFQLSLLPSDLPEHEALEIAVAMRTATEVGGDYYDVHGHDRGPLTVVIGDATGHGAAAGTMVTVAKSLFSASAEPLPGAFLDEAATAVRRMDLERMCMALQVVRFDGATMRLASAGMPPAMIWRRDNGTVEEVLVPGLPVGAARAGGYHEVAAALAPGDTVLLMSDGFPELPDPAGEPLGYERARDAFAAAAGRTPEEVVQRLLEVADDWRGESSPPDDITFLVVRVREQR